MQPSPVTRRTWKTLLPRAVSAAVLIALPCLTLLGFGAGLTQAVAADAWGGESAALDRPAAAADLGPRPEAVTLTASEAVSLKAWEYTGSSNTNPYSSVIGDVIDANNQAMQAQVDVNSALLALQGSNVSSQQIQQALKYLQQASQEENRAYQDLQDAGKGAAKLNNASLATMLNQDAFNMAGVAGAFQKELQSAQQQANQFNKNPQSAAALLISYINQTNPPNFQGFNQLANEGVQYTKTAVSQISPYQ